MNLAYSSALSNTRNSFDGQIIKKESENLKKITKRKKKLPAYFFIACRELRSIIWAGG